MNPLDYAKVKQVFAKAIELNVEEREAFVLRECGGDSVVHQEVLSLLSHHQDGSILESSEEDPGPVERSSSDRPEPFLVSSEMWGENRQILRRRLVIVAVAMAILSLVSILRLLVMPEQDRMAAQESGYAARVFAAVFSLVIAGWLSWTKQLGVRQLRLAELLLVGGICFLEIVVYVGWMRALAIEQDLATAISVNDWHYIAWTMIIFVYGVFMPNTWQRAASVLIPLAGFPLFVTWLVNVTNPDVEQMVAQSHLGERWLVPIVAACIAIYAAHIIHGANVIASQARKLAQYRLVRLIGEGGMGSVYEAEHLLLKRNCAVKLIRSDKSSEQRVLRRFQREVRATARLTHPHTIEVYDYGKTKDEVFFFAMELLPGMNLRDLVRQHGPLPPERAVHFLIDVCDALTEAHGSDMIHRDIKPANIFASQRGGIHDFTKLLDFGVVREIKVDASLSLTSKMVAGTPSFMSPEQASMPLAIDARSDLYSLGAVGYYLLSGRPPFVAATPTQVMLMLVEREPDQLSVHRSDVPSDLESVVMRCLQTRPEERFQNAGELRQALELCECAGSWTRQRAADWWAENQPDLERTDDSNPDLWIVAETEQIDRNA